MNHKCCGGNRKGQFIEIEFLNLLNVDKLGEGRICLGLFETLFSTYYREEWDGFYDKRSSRSERIERPYPTNTQTRISSGRSFLNATIRGAICDSEYSSSSRVFQTIETGGSTYTQSTKEQWFNRDKGEYECFRGSDTYSYDVGGIGFYQGNCYPISSIRNLQLTTLSYTTQDYPSTHNFKVKKTASYAISGASSGVYYPPDSNEPQPLSSFKICKKLNLLRKELEEGVIVFEQLDKIEIRILKTKRSFFVKKPNDCKFMGYSIGECGCAKGEIECTRNGRKCCINCCKVVEKLYNRYKEGN